jgi:hypothetical protein
MVTSSPDRANEDRSDRNLLAYSGWRQRSSWASRRLEFTTDRKFIFHGGQRPDDTMVLIMALAEICPFLSVFCRFPICSSWGWKLIHHSRGYHAPTIPYPPETCAFLFEEFGIRRTPATLAKQRVIGGNAPPYRKLNRSIYYAISDLRDWATRALGIRYRTTTDCASSASS